MTNITNDVLRARRSELDAGEKGAVYNTHHAFVNGSETSDIPWAAGNAMDAVAGRTND